MYEKEVIKDVLETVLMDMTDISMVECLNIVRLVMAELEER